MPECRFTSTALGALRLAQENAARLGHSYVGSEHLLLGLASQEYSAAARSLQSSGVDSRSLRSAISQLVGTGVPARSLHQGLTPKCCLAIQQAAAASRRLGQNAVSAEHLLLGLLQDRECAACRLMAEQGADLDQLSQGLAAFLGGEELPTRSVRPREPERSTDTRLLDQCARDLTRMAADVEVVNTDDLKLLGKHNFENVMAAVAMAYYDGVAMDSIRKSICEFTAVAHRIEYVTEKNGVKYYNDSKGTNPDAAIKGIQAMNRPTLLIGGGYDKQSSYDEWIESFAGKVRYLVLIGQTKEKIKETAEKHGFHEIILCENLEEAVKVCAEKAQEGDAVLLSPACASWGQFDNYEQRGDMFKEYVRNL